MTKDLGINNLLAHLALEFQRITFAGGFRTACKGSVVVVKLDDPVFAISLISVFLDLLKELSCQIAQKTTE